MKPDDLRGIAYAPIESIEAVVQEMLTLIRERMRMNQTQAGMLEPIVRRAVHQIARKLEMQPAIYGAELVKLTGHRGLQHAIEWINREFGPGIINYAERLDSEKRMIAPIVCRASFLSLMDAYKTQKAKQKEAAKMEAMAEASPGYGSPEPITTAKMIERTYTRPAPKKAVIVPPKAPPRLSINGKRIGRPPKKEKAAV